MARQTPKPEPEDATAPAQSVPSLVERVAAWGMRAGALVFGVVWLGGVGTMFGFLASEFYRELRQAFVWQPVDAVVTAYTPTEKDDFDDPTPGCIAYRYRVDGRSYEGDYPAPQGMRARDEFAEGLRGPFAPGDAVTAYYDPAAPAESMLNPAAQPFFIGFFIFMSPFAAVGLGMVGMALFAPAEMLKHRGPRGRKRGPPGGGLLVMYFVTSAAGAFGFFFLASLLDWRIGMAVGAVTWLVVVPGVTLTLWRGGRALVAARRRAKRSPADELAALATAPSAAARPPAGEAAEPPAAAPIPPAGAPYLPVGETLRLPPSKGLRSLVVFAVVWWAVVGVFLAFVGTAYWRHLDAAARFASTEGVVVASKLQTHDSSDSGSTYSALVRYRYTVAGQEYTGDRHDFLGGSSSGYGYHKAIVDRHPAGAPVTVYYDPDAPADSVLQVEVPGTVVFLGLFLQPFLVAGFAVAGAGVCWARFRGRVQRFLDAPMQVPCDIPSWGTLRSEMGDLVIVRRRFPLRPVVGFLVGYGLACFVSIFVLAMALGGFEQEPGASWWALRIALGAGAVGAVVAVAGGRGKAVVRMDSTGGALSVTSPKRRIEVPFAEIAGWALRPVRNPTPSRGADSPAMVPLLAAVTKDGREVPVHVFSAGEEAKAIARKTAAGLADLTHRPLVAPPAGTDTPGAAEPAPANPTAIFTKALREVRTQRAAARQYDDLA